MNSNPLAAAFLFLRAQPSLHRTAALPAVLAVWTFSLPGGGAEALTRSVSLCSRCLSASGSPEPPPRPTDRPEHQLREDSPPPTTTPTPLFNSLSIPPSPNFFFSVGSLASLPLSLSIYQSRAPLHAPTLTCQWEVKEVFRRQEEPTALFHITPQRAL